MKKFLCMMMATVLAVVMMRPFEAKASSDRVEEIVSGQVTNVVCSLDGYGVQEYDPTSNNAYYDYGYYYSDYNVVYTIKMPVTANNYLYGHFEFLVPFEIEYPVNSSNWKWQITTSYCNIEGIDVVVGNNVGGSAANSSGGLTYSDSVKFYVDFKDVYVPGSHLYYYFNICFNVRVAYDDYEFRGASGLELGTASFPYNGVLLRSVPFFVTRFKILTDPLIEAVENFNTVVENKFTTLFTFGRQWTDDIIDAVVGQGGGSNTINSAQDKLDQQLTDFEAAENQIADQVIDKIEIPTLVLNDSQASALSWVIGMINTWYLEFSELQVLFGSIMFFGIIGVVLFGRRSL